MNNKPRLFLFIQKLFFNFHVLFFLVPDPWKCLNFGFWWWSYSSITPSQFLARPSQVFATVPILQSTRTRILPITSSGRWPGRCAELSSSAMPRSIEYQVITASFLLLSLAKQNNPIWLNQSMLSFAVPFDCYIILWMIIKVSCILLLM